VPTRAANSADHEVRDKLAAALYRLLRREAAVELAQDEDRLVARYQKLAARDEGLRVAGRKAQAALGLADVLAGRSADAVARLIEAEFTSRKGYDPAVIRDIARRVRARLLAQAAQGPP
jgi:hypothetical protein